MSEEIVLIEENENKTLITIKLNRLDKKNAFNYDLMVGLQKALDRVPAGPCFDAPPPADRERQRSASPSGPL